MATGHGLSAVPNADVRIGADAVNSGTGISIVYCCGIDDNF